MKAPRRKLPKNEIIDYSKVLKVLKMIELIEKETNLVVDSVDNPNGHLKFITSQAKKE